MSVSIFIKASGNVAVVGETGGGLVHDNVAKMLIEKFGSEERRIDLTTTEELELKQELELKNVQD